MWTSEYDTGAKLDRMLNRPITTMEEAAEMFERLRREELAISGRPLAHAMFGMILAWRSARIIPQLVFEAWLILLQSNECPGHGPAAAWCAYCGDIPREMDESEVGEYAARAPTSTSE